MNKIVFGFPKSVRVGAFKFKIQYLKDLSSASNDPNAIALFSLPDETIYMKKHLKLRVKKEALMHEIMHAIWTVSGASVLDCNEELIVSMLSPLILDTLNRNKEMAGYLIGL